MKLKQIKEFNTQTVTNDIAAELCAIGGLWNHYKEDDNKKFEITDEYNTWRKNGQPATNEPDGVKIKSKVTPHIFRIWKDGRLMCTNYHKKGDWRSSRNINGKVEHEYYNETVNGLEYPCNQIDYIQKLIELGFYTIE